jgi:hypothetical protein
MKLVLMNITQQSDILDGLISMKVQIKNETELDGCMWGYLTRKFFSHFSFSSGGYIPDSEQIIAGHICSVKNLYGNGAITIELKCNPADFNDIRDELICRANDLKEYKEQLEDQRNAAHDFDVHEHIDI